MPAARRPVIIFLDINMPRKNGLEALAEIKSDPELRRIPVIMLTTSDAESDMLRSYDLGVNSFITKPVSFPDFLSTMKRLGDYWLELVKVPPRPRGE
jgi:CheY-like chemotaxis protein